MKINIKQLIPTPIELVAGGFLSFAIILLANSKQLLGYYGLQSSDQFIKSSAGNTVTQGLKVIDSFSATNGVVTFLIWAVVGVVCFGIVEALGNGYQEMRLNRQVSSKQYIHPTSFSQVKFWRGVVLDTFTLLLGLALVAIVSLLFALLVLPLGLAYSRVFLFDLSVMNILNMLLGLVVVAAGLMVVDIIIRFLLYRRRIISLR